MANLDHIQKRFKETVKVSKDVYASSKGTSEEPQKPVKDDGAWVNSPFGNRIDPINPQNKEFHRGIDIITSPNDNVTIYAAYSGTVIFVGVPKGNPISEGCGYRIIIKGKNDDYYHVYGHLKDKSAFVRKDDDVVAGKTKLGIMGNTGSSTGTHLHFAMLKRAKYAGGGGIPVKNHDAFKNPLDVQNLYPTSNPKKK